MLSRFHVLATAAVSVAVGVPAKAQSTDPETIELDKTAGGARASGRPGPAMDAATL
ncbi:MAG: hypothetical protein KDJ86_10300 [Bauldia sp.]|uniref:hypothetical protein n=1 Tax=Bauldia sp. TaxID=2575872 RepID=UPI001D2CA0A5|nr:hypothetical protein [Bauldia sp.]MCB1496166.1 hypothetical protein [Bauldia sp.]